MKIGIFIPTSYRSHNLERLFDSIYRTIDDLDEHFYIYAMCPEDDQETIDLLDEFHVQYQTDYGDMRFSKRIQHMYNLTSDPWFLTGADDLVFHKGWFEAARKYMDEYSVISFDDMCNPTLPGTNFLIKREYIEKQSGVVDSPRTVFCQEYFHNFVDNELWGTAKARGEFVKCDGKIEHFHHTVGKAEYDNIYDIAQQHFHSDAQLFHSRSHIWSR